MSRKTVVIAFILSLASLLFSGYLKLNAEMELQAILLDNISSGIDNKEEKNSNHLKNEMESKRETPLQILSYVNVLIPVLMVVCSILFIVYLILTQRDSSTALK